MVIGWRLLDLHIWVDRFKNIDFAFNGYASNKVIEDIKEDLKQRQIIL